MYLVDCSDNSPFWATENQIPNSILKSFLTESQKNNISCKTLKSFALPCDKKSRTVGEFLAVYNCGIICGFREIFGSETLVQTACFLMEVYDNIEQKPLYIGYDDGCLLKKFIDISEKIQQKTERLVELRKKNIIIDRFHYIGHKKNDEYCKTKCNLRVIYNGSK